MGLIQLIFSVYFVFLLIRLTVPNTGQMAFNQPYQLVVKFTRPVLDFLGRPFRRPPAAPLAALAVGLLILIQGLISTGGEGVSPVYDLYFARLNFHPSSSLWGVGKSLIYFLGLTYQIYFFLMMIMIISPLRDSSDQISRLVKMAASPLRKGRDSGPASLLILMGFFTASFYLLNLLFVRIGWMGSDPAILTKSFLAALALPLRLIKVMIILIIIRAVLSWFPLSGGGRQTISWLNTFTYPVLQPFRKLKLNLGAFDLTPIVAIFSLIILREILSKILASIFQAVG